jgi:hypothetical protein
MNQAIRTLTISFCLIVITIQSYSQQSLWFGTLKSGNELLQGRFEVTADTLIRSIVYAPYGITPTTFQNLKHEANRLSFSFNNNGINYNCALTKHDSSSFKGPCISRNADSIQMIIRQFTPEDAVLQGDSHQPGKTDLEILDRALLLLNNGKNWNRKDDRVCDLPSYPYKWSLFCALHQASIDVDSQYRHLRPAIAATRKAIAEITGGKKYPHLLRDFNNEAISFNVIRKALTRAKEIIAADIK